MGTARGLRNIIGSRITNERTLEMSDFPNSAGGAGSVRYINPDSLNKNPAFTNVVVVEGNVRTVHIGGQDAINASGEIVGKDDIVSQIEQVLANLRAALEAGGARPEHIIKWNLYVVEGQSLQAGFAAVQNAWPETPNPPAITVVFVSFGFARLRALIAKHSEEESLEETLLEELYSFVGEGWEQEDDITLLTLRRSAP